MSPGRYGYMLNSKKREINIPYRRIWINYIVTYNFPSCPYIWKSENYFLPKRKMYVVERM